MSLTDVNEVKIYNLSAGKSLPDWLTDQKKKKLLNKNGDLRRKIDLIQDFDMPGVSTSIQVTPDNQFVIATGTYKPRIKCYDFNNLSVKFERCFDSEVVTFEILSEDYSKIVFLQCDRHIEFHTAPGRHYRLRIPKFGRDLAYHTPSCDLFLAASSPEIYRFNLERGQFSQSFETQSPINNVCEVNPEHHLLCIGTEKGTVEAWDPRQKSRCASVQVTMENTGLDGTHIPSITALKFKNGLQFGAGTSDGQIFLYDLRSNRPFTTKDHMNNLPIKRINFNPNQSIVYSMDSGVLKMWDENTGKQLTFIESSSEFNDFCTIANTGMLFFAQEDKRMQTFYVPQLGPAPKWCSFLDNLTEELDTELVQNIYDDYKFVTKQELAELNLEDLKGTNLLRAYMHGYFVDIRLYRKARSAVDYYSFDRYKKQKARQQIEMARPSRVEIKTNLPKVNKDLAEKLIDTENQSLMQDQRFSALFADPDFTIDEGAEEFKMLKPVLAHLKKLKPAKTVIPKVTPTVLQEDDNAVHESTDEDLFSEQEDADESSDDDQRWTKDVKKQYKAIQREKRREEAVQEQDSIKVREEDDLNVGWDVKKSSKRRQMTLGDRVAKQESAANAFKVEETSTGRQMKFIVGSGSKGMRVRANQIRQHREERKKLVRKPRGLKLKRLPFK
ncbi:nucleolar protein 10 [Phlebotomus argentipes]|uniref:nucleolar protein 10 n=1 Tax=Phlebotomus argentipes TaxID=94469 RepID=UPI002892E942|nr:nucleolar protein 10 [Phlebotomus argentipes]